jgi:Mrp family chromosome partitioning ATPase
MLDQFLESRGQVVTQGPGIIAAARQIADVVLVDAPGLLVAHDAIALLPAVDVVLVVAQHAFTKADHAQEAGDVLRRFRAPVLGVVFTNVPNKKKAARGDRNGPEDHGEPVTIALDPMPTAPVTGAGLWV